ncbi:MAG: NAD-glutamate dehydrogenase [Propionivibrio sp.]|uniref:NAD-glutamate dehydrogenase n=1 Tax=Propionivibrio sp. TaxID=2212460 RepID=UPI0025E3E495|nr:NAD-glutamate dehydrogenase [Propionivibrio sp.]MBL0206714.1 NAD-glutamate dehydrogenase [Propionivibrio sp.]
MLEHLEDKKQDSLAKVLKLAGSRLPPQQKSEAQAFIRDYYEQMDAEDLFERSIEDLYGAAMAHLTYSRSFVGGRPKLRVYNPQLEEHGWTSPHSIVEVINDDMPFLVDSVTMEVNRQGFTLHLLIHPVFRTHRDAHGKLLAIGAAGADGTPESFMHIEVDRETDPARLKVLEDRLLSVLADVRVAVADWRPMLNRLSDVIRELETPPAGLSETEVDEGRVFLRWAYDHHFTFLGFREYELVAENGEDQLMIVPESGLGILREPRQGALSRGFAESPPSIRKLARAQHLLVLTKANVRATVHRPGYLNYIGIKRFDSAGGVVGERRFIGLYTSSAYYARIREIPLLRNKATAVLEKAGFAPNSHMGKSLLTILETYPRDELFQIDETALLETALGILRLGDRRKIRVFMRREAYGRYYSCLIYLPREKFNTESRVRIQGVLKRALQGTSVEYTVELSEATLARIHFLVRSSPRDETVVDARDIESQINLALRDWADDLKLALIESRGEEAANQLLNSYGAAFPVAYRDTVSVRIAVRDIQTIEHLSETQAITMRLYRPVEADSRTLRLRVYRLGEPVPLSGSLPMLENMGVSVLDEQSYTLDRGDAGTVHIHDFGMHTVIDLPDITTVRPLFEDSFAKVWRREIESDGFNRLVLAAGLSSDEVIVLRAYAKYLRQAGFTFSQAYIEQTLVDNIRLARLLIALFHARFDPAAGGGREAAQSGLVEEIKQALDEVASADDDRILRRFLAVIQATIRTNFYQRDAAGCRKPYVSFKLESAKVPELPEPKPLYEIWFYSPRVEGIHLRGGKVARGGLRWSDRMEDFRTEVLGLVKAQMVKNVVIVPVGSKGGFVLKNPPPQTDREAYLNEGIECYKSFLRGLLDITDNLVANEIVPPKNVARHDGDDPYLVVAADKGTATFSDFANAVSNEYGFWLGDAFASGGSVGYDHKKMGITARGAWESVKRHFLEMGIDTQTTSFTVVGIGDMSGDVFGNGMLLSRHIKLLAAFDHRHIFLDPNPDTEASFNERQRLFALPRSSWEDYDKTLLSGGGGIFPRSAKTIPLTAEMRNSLGVTATTLTPAELMRAILKAPVDLFYNGGIGTYIKAREQSNLEVGDRANDAVRVNGADLRCKVVAEGGNLGCTQLGRIEFAMNGGRINTDAIDNSAGVDCSDHEVNIKILLGLVEADGELTRKQRDKLLAEMTDEVGELALADNYYQTQSQSVTGARAVQMLDGHQRFIRHLEKTGRLDRAVEYLPTDEQIAERRAARLGLTSPERAVLLAYSKMVLFDQLLASDLVDDPYVEPLLTGYFPEALRARYAGVMHRHPLKREIVATVLANSMINHVGIVFTYRMCEETGAEPHDVARAYILARDIYDFPILWAGVEALDGQVAAPVQNRMLIDAGRLVLRAVLWFLRTHHEKIPIDDVIKRFRPGVAELNGMLCSLLNTGDLNAVNERRAELQSAGVPDRIAEQVAQLDASYAALDIVDIATGGPLGVDRVAEIYFALVGKLEMRWFGDQINALSTNTHWQALARNALRDDLSRQTRLLTASVMRLSPGGTDAAAMLAAWEAANFAPLTRLKEMVADLKTGPALDLAMLSVAMRELRSLT